MGLGKMIIDAIEARQNRKKENQQGAVGDFWRNGGKRLLYRDLPVETGSLVIDAGAYQGEWTTGMIVRYGCRSILFEPVPEYANILREEFRCNPLVKINQAALGGKDRKTVFYFNQNGTTEHTNLDEQIRIEANVFDVDRVIKELDCDIIACLKLNIEGGEYEVLERLAQTDKLYLCSSILVQFHRQPEGYEARYKEIVSMLKNTHSLKWGYDWMWELWVKNTPQNKSGNT